MANNKTAVIQEEIRTEKRTKAATTTENNSNGTKKTWVKFDDDKSSSQTVAAAAAAAAVLNTNTICDSNRENEAPAVLNTSESVQINLDTTGNTSTLSLRQQSDQLRSVDLSKTGPITVFNTPNEPIRQGFTNGDVIVTLLPINTRLPWITPAQFRPELVPEELMAQGLTLTVEEYVQAMDLLVNDVRFTLYNVCYKRVLIIWISVAFLVLLALLFSGLTGLTLFGLGIGWLVLNAGAIFISIWLKFKLSRNLEHCLANVNKQLLRHKIVVALDDRGRVSCHKVNLCFLYLDPAQCISHLQSSIEQQERDLSNGWEQRMDICTADIVIQGATTTRLSRKQERATLLYLRYVSRWAKKVVRSELISPPATGGRHCATVTCPCQYVELHLQCKPAGPCLFCFYMSDTTMQLACNPLRNVEQQAVF